MDPPQRPSGPTLDAKVGASVKFLLVGLGGIGQRHARNLRALYGERCELLAYRVRRDSPVLNDSLQVDSRDGLEDRYKIRAYDKLDEALEERPNAAIICNPSSMHVAVALSAARAGCHLLIEKPLSHTLDQLDELAAVVKRNSLVCMVAYQLRFHPCLTLAHRLLTAGKIGRPIACRAIVGEYLPGWHRYEDYRSMYAAKRELGGGVVLSQIHELDILYWFFGRPRRIVAFGGHWSDLQIDVEDVASSLLAYDGMVAHLHQDYLQQPPVRQMEIIGNNGKIEVDLRALRVRAYGDSGSLIEERGFEQLQRNRLFLDEMTCFVDAIGGGPPVPVNLEDGRQSLEMALALKLSIETNGPISMSGAA
jgi:predicted dehydrogenase